MKSIQVRELRNEYARVLRDVEGGETFTITHHGRAVAQIGPVPPDLPAPRDSVPAGEAWGAMAHLGEQFTADLRADLAGADWGAVDPFERWEADRAERDAGR